MNQRKADYDFLANGGEMGDLIAKKDWSTHPLGPIDDWPQSFKSALSICLYSKFPMAIYWGKAMHLLYNDAWSPIAKDKHPAALGQTAQKVWGPAWGPMKPAMVRVLKNGEASLHKNALPPLKSNNFIQESYFDYTLSPIFGENQQIVGIFNVGSEVTERILTERRNNTLRKLSEKSIIVESGEAACILIANVLSEAPEDIPFGLLYLISRDRQKLRLVGCTSIDHDDPIAYTAIDLKAANYILPFKEVVESKKPQLVEGLDQHFELPGGVWDEMATSAALVPIIRPNTKELYGVFVGGISPRLTYDTAYGRYFKQITELAAFSIGNAYDLKRKLLLEARERQAQERLQTALSTGSIGIWLWDIPSNKVIADKNLASRLGVDYEKAKNGLPISVFTESIHPDDHEWVTRDIRRAIEDTKLFEAEYRTVGPDGAVKWVLARGRVEDDANGEPTRFPGVMVDITDRKEIEHELANTERTFDALFESSIIGVIVATLDGQIHEANETFLNMFGFSKKDLADGFYSHMITPSKSKGVTSIIYQKLREKGEVEPVEREYVRKDGTTIPVLIGAVMISGSTDRFISFMLDISEQKQLLALNKAKDEFISIASHQLRTPATGVKQYLGMLIEGYAGKLTKGQQKMLETAYQSNERQLIIVNDLLRVAQADADEIQLRFEDTDLTIVIQAILDEQAQKFEKAGQSIEFIQNSRGKVAPLDPLHIRMVLENIIDNAHKYTPANKTITVTLSHKRGSMIVSVKDQGVGIYKKDMPKLFKKFSRIENALSMSAGGTGLGLYWVNKIIDLHEGTIQVNSRYRHGTEFVITLPINSPKG
ncbi:MAG: PAS domain-containing sensor histidine kinase [Candidatus Saccharimonadales bacterium]